MRAWRVLAAAGVLAASAIAIVGAQVSQPYSGIGDYQVYCSSCHGAEARGDGAIAKSLKIRPTDLTQLAKGNEGVFPADKVFKIIDGRKGVAHKDSDMPMWGDVFGKASDSASAANTAARIDTMVKYLETLQTR
jgi:mono/diheme cytochrome c family protein